MPRAGDEISRLAETLNEMLARLEAAFEHERRFVADASHELRTPLALLRPSSSSRCAARARTRSSSGAALGRGGDRPARAARRGSAADRARRAGRAADRGASAVAAAELLDTVAERFAGAAGEQGRTVEVGRRRLVLDADPLRLEQALGNLVDNALAPRRGRSMLSADARDDRVELHVARRGAGLPARRSSPRAFDRFSRADEARSAAAAAGSASRSSS